MKYMSNCVTDDIPTCNNNGLGLTQFNYVFYDSLSIFNVSLIFINIHKYMQIIQKR